MANSIYDLSTTASSNTTIDGTDVSGTTGKVKDGDNVMRSLGAYMAQWVDDQGGVATTSGSANTQTVTLASGFSAYATGQTFTVKLGYTNTSTTVTLNVNSIGAKSVKVFRDGSLADPAVGDIQAGNYGTFIHDGTYLVLLGGSTGALLKNNNLSDLANTATSRTNLGAVGKIVTQAFTSSGTYTPTTNMLYCIIEAVGGGGGGGGAASTNASSMNGGGGGGAGEYSRVVASAADIGASKSVTIGAAGSGASAGANTGGTGGTTSVGVLISAVGGVGGQGAPTQAAASGGLGGSGGTGSLKIGEAGDTGSGYTSTSIIGNAAAGGKGGSSPFGAGGKSAGNSNGNAASGYGSGGSGGSDYNGGGNKSGGAGTAGKVIITEYCSA